MYDILYFNKYGVPAWYTSFTGEYIDLWYDWAEYAMIRDNDGSIKLREYNTGNSWLC